MFNNSVTAYATVTVPYEATPIATTSSTSTKRRTHRPRPTTSAAAVDSNVVYVTMTYVDGVPVQATPVASDPAVVTITSTPEPVYVAPTTPPAYSAPDVVPSSAPAAPSPSSAPSTSDPVAQAIVDKHNVYRANHNASPLTWDDSLAAYAADHMPECVMQHTPGGIHGENLSFGYADPVQAVHDWYNEGNQYDYNNPTFGVSFKSLYTWNNFLCIHANIILRRTLVTSLKSYGREPPASVAISTLNATT